jgi:hypothetical protein
MEEAVTPAYLRDQAERCLRLAKGVSDDDAAAALRKMATEYQIQANRLDQSLNGLANPIAGVPPPAPTS